MVLEVDVRSLPDGLPGAYTEFVDGAPSVLLVSRDLPHEDQEALGVEAECYKIRSPRAKRKFCYSPRSLEEMDRERIRALRRCIEDKRPDWLELMRWACGFGENETHRIISLSGVPPYPAVAILENMVARGEFGDF